MNGEREGRGRRRAVAAAASAAILLSGCGLYEALGGMPRERSEIRVGDAPIARVFQCAQGSVITLEKADSSWATRVTKRDERQGTWETGDFDAPNQGGFRLRLRLRDGVLHIDLKGAGAYYHDLGVEQGIAAFEQEIGRCLQSPSIQGTIHGR